MVYFALIMAKSPLGSEGTPIAHYDIYYSTAQSEAMCSHQSDPEHLIQLEQ